VGQAISHNSDTLMVVHIPANRQYVQVVSLPRDSWEEIPGHGMNKINAAFGLGGPRLMVSTVAAATGLTINDYVEVNFLGFVKIINALGGVSICLPYAVDDGYSGLHLSAGQHHVGGITALEFARDRHSFAASDLARIDDQQQLMSTLLSRTVSSGTLSNPLRLRRVLSALTAAVQVDQGFNVTAVASELRGIRPGNVVFSTVPLSNLNYQTPTGELAVQWNATRADRLFTRMANDEPPSGVHRPRHHSKARHGASRHGPSQHRASQHRASQHGAAHRRGKGHHAQAKHRHRATTDAGATAPIPGQERTAAQDACH
jgi:LCP family protein required for cell wall assembly